VFFPWLLAMREDLFGFEMREVGGDFMEAPSWGSAFPRGLVGNAPSAPLTDGVGSVLDIPAVEPISE
jgi:hypothetical protein